jgi:hypothetical protein
MLLLHPMGEGGAQIEADLLEIADQGVGAVAGIVDFLRPVGVRFSAILLRDLPAEGVDPRRLVEVAVHAKGSLRH